MKLIYLDHHATTPVDPRVLEAMLPYFQEKFGNASSKTHRWGWEAEAGVEKARNQVAHLLHATPQELFFTSGATESNNTVLRGVVENGTATHPHLITVATEHSSILDLCQSLEQRGISVTYLPVDRAGQISSQAVEEAITPNTVLISVMMANNEIGTLQPIAEIGKMTRKRGVLFHTDAAQAANQIPIDVSTLGVDFLSLSAHKMYGPKGVGALYVRSGVKLPPLLYGGGHEGGRRSGTLNVPGIVGMGMACELVTHEMQTESERLRVLRDFLKEKNFNHLDEVFLNGHPTERLPNHLSLSFSGVRSENLIMELPEIALSSGSACRSARPGISHVLKAIGLTNDLAAATIRFGLGRFNTQEEIEEVAQRLVSVVQQIRRRSL